MPPSSHENDPPSPRKSSWWNPNRGSWRSPWSLDDSGLDRPRKAAPPAPERRRSSRIDTPSLKKAVLQAQSPTIAAKSQIQPALPGPEPVPKKPEPVSSPAVNARAVDEVKKPPSAAKEPVAVEPPSRFIEQPMNAQPADQEPGSSPSAQAVVEKPVVRRSPRSAPVVQLPRLDEQVVRIEMAPPAQSSVPSEPVLEVPVVPDESRPAPSQTEVPVPVPDSVLPAVDAAPMPLKPEPAPHPANAVPVFRSRRIQPPKAQPPPDLVLPRAESTRPPSEPVQLPRAMPNPPPSDVDHGHGRATSPVKKPGWAPVVAGQSEPEPESERDLPPQIGEWPPRRARTTQTNPWRRLMVFSLAVFAFTVVTWIYWQDDKPPSEETLQLKRDFEDSPRPAAIGRMRTLLTSVAPVQGAELVSVPPSQWQTPDLSRMVEANGVARENLRDLLEEPDWHPRNKCWFEEDFGMHGAWTNLAILKQAEAAYLMRRGEEEAAFTAAIDLAQLARSLQDLDAWPSYYDRSLQILERASQTLVDLLNTTRLDSVRLGAFQDEYTKCAPSDQLLRDGLGAWFLYEKKVMLEAESREAIDTLPGGIFYQRPGRLFFKPNRTLRLFALSFHDLRDEAEKSPYARSSQIALRLSRIGPGFGLPNSAGENYFADRIAPYVSLPERQSIAHAQHAVVITLFALRRFHADYHRLPPKLLNLRPDFVKDLPIDPFSGEPLKYDFASGVVSSVGTNFTLDGGKPAVPPFSDPREIAAQVGTGS